MGRTIGLISALCLILIALAAYHYPFSPLFWNASTSTVFNLLRCAFGLTLLLIYLHVPKKKIYREMLALCTLLFVAWLWGRADTGIIDSFTFSAAAVALLLILLESKPADEPFKTIEFMSVARDITVDKLKNIVAPELRFFWPLFANAGVQSTKHLVSRHNGKHLAHGIK